jgi:Icc protein
MNHTIIQISDTHLVADGLMHDRVDTAARLERMLAKIEASAWRPELLLLSGDLADHGEAGAYTRLREIIEPVATRLGAQVAWMPGNHDDGETLRRELLGVEPDGRPLDRVVWLGDLRVITLDSTAAPLHHGELADEQLAWLAQQLATPAADGTVLAIHHPPLPSSSDFATALSLREPQRLADVLRGSDVRIVLCGHLHTVIAGTLGGIPVWSGPAMAYYGDVAGPAQTMRAIAGGGVTIVETLGDDTIATYAPLDAADEEPIYAIGHEALAELIGTYANH